MRKRFAIALLASHVVAAALGFAAGVYVLPILVAPPGPDELTLETAARESRFVGRFSPDRTDSDALHYGDGEILLQPPSLMRGYLERPDLTAAAFHHGWLRSGDSGSIDEQGHIRLRGRRSFEINRAGIKVSPEEVDLLLERHPAVAEACAFGIEDAIAGELVAVAIRLHEDIEPAHLERWCRERIRPECVPASWYVVDELARNERGKLDRRAVRAACLETRP